MPDYPPLLSLKYNKINMLQSGIFLADKPVKIIPVRGNRLQHGLSDQRRDKE